MKHEGSLPGAYAVDRLNSDGFLSLVCTVHVTFLASCTWDCNIFSSGALHRQRGRSSRGTQQFLEHVKGLFCPIFFSALGKPADAMSLGHQKSVRHRGLGRA